MAWDPRTPLTVPHQYTAIHTHICTSVFGLFTVRCVCLFIGAFWEIPDTSNGLWWRGLHCIPILALHPVNSWICFIFFIIIIGSVGSRWISHTNIWASIENTFFFVFAYLSMTRIPKTTCCFCLTSFFLENKRYNIEFQKVLAVFIQNSSILHDET